MAKIKRSSRGTDLGTSSAELFMAAVLDTSRTLPPNQETRPVSIAQTTVPPTTIPPKTAPPAPVFPGGTADVSGTSSHAGALTPGHKDGDLFGLSSEKTDLGKSTAGQIDFGKTRRGGASRGPGTKNTRDLSKNRFRRPTGGKLASDSSGTTGNSRKYKSSRRIRPLWLVVGVVAFVSLVMSVLYFTPLISVRNIEVEGTEFLTAAEVEKAAAITQGTPLIRIDQNEIARRVAKGLPRVDVAWVRVSPPSTVKITVQERVAVAFYSKDGQALLIDKKGVVFASQTRADNLPRFNTDHIPEKRDATTRAAMKVLSEISAELFKKIVEIKAISEVNISLTLRDNRVVIWGDENRNDEKESALTSLLSRKANEYNVSAPNNPVVIGG